MSSRLVALDLNCALKQGYSLPPNERLMVDTREMHRVQGGDYTQWTTRMPSPRLFSRQSR
jgi:hypothetical protein